MATALLQQSTLSLLAAFPTTTAGQAATLLRSPLIKHEGEAAKRADAQVFQVVSITDFPETGYLGAAERRITVHNERATAEKYRLQPNDVLISIVGSIGRVAILPPDYHFSAIPSSNILIFRPRHASQQNSLLAGMFYKSFIGQQILSDLTHGTTIPLISKKAFASTPFPESTDDTITAAVSLYDQEVWVDAKCRELCQTVENGRNDFLIRDRAASPSRAN